MDATIYCQWLNALEMLSLAPLECFAATEPDKNAEMPTLPGKAKSFRKFPAQRPPLSTTKIKQISRRLRRRQKDLDAIHRALDIVGLTNKRIYQVEGGPIRRITRGNRQLKVGATFSQRLH
jgi:hypothetical protein